MLCHYVTAHVADTSTIGQERQVLMARRRSKAEVEELEDEEELDLEDLDDEADVEDEDVEEEDEDEDEEEAPRKKKSKFKSKAAAKKKKAKANGNIGSADLAEALGTDGRNLRVMLRAKGVEKNETGRYEWESVDDALEELGFDDIDEAQDALKEARDERLEELKNRPKKKKSKSKKVVDEDEDEDEDDEDDEDEEEEEEAPAPKKRAAKKTPAKKPTRSRAKK